MCIISDDFRLNLFRFVLSRFKIKPHDDQTRLMSSEASADTSRCCLIECFFLMSSFINVFIPVHGHVYGCLSPPDAFLVMSPQKLCLSSRNQRLILERCDVTNPAQQWAWLGGARLLHAQSSRCLWADPSPHLSAHARPAKLIGCREAPAWSCFNTDGALEMADTHLFLKKQGARLAIGGNMRASEWSRYDVDSGGNARMTSLCADAGERGWFQ